VRQAEVTKGIRKIDVLRRAGGNDGKLNFRQMGIIPTADRSVR
jgi:hypothetical protein